MPLTRVADQECADCFEELWEHAFRQRPFDVLCTLLRVGGMQDAGWDPFEESAESFKDYNWYMKAQSEQLSEKAKWRLGLLMYCQACEMSAVHATLANLLRINLRQPYHVNPLGSLGRADKKRVFRWFPPSAKVKWKKLRDMAAEADKAALVRIIENVYNDNVRNAFSHSDYVINKDSFRWTEGGMPDEIPLGGLNTLIANSFSFFGAFMGVRHRWLGLTAAMPRYHRWPNYEVLELLKTEGRVDGFHVHFSNGNGARFLRRPTGVDATNIVIEPDGTINFMVGLIDDLQQKYLVEGREVRFGCHGAVDTFAE